MGWFEDAVGDVVDVVTYPARLVYDEAVQPVLEFGKDQIVDPLLNDVVKPVVRDVYGGVKGAVNLGAKGATGIVNKAGQVVDSGTNAIDGVFKWLPLIVVGGVILGVVVVPALKDLKK